MSLNLIRRIKDYVVPILDRHVVAKNTYDRADILTDLGQAISTLKNIEQIVGLASVKIQAALQTASIAIFLKEEAYYNCLIFLTLDEALSSVPDIESTLILSAQSPIVKRLQTTTNLFTIDPQALSDVVSPSEAFKARSDRAVFTTIQARLLIPILVKSELLGIIALGDKAYKQSFTTADQEMLKAISAQIALAIENSLLSRRIAEDRNKYKTGESHNIIPGTTIDGKYLVESIMGQGGMGKVFRVNHIHMKKTLALKLMHAPSQGLDPKIVTTRLARFQREAETLAKLSHPHIVGIIDFGIWGDNLPYIVLEYIEGYSLRHHLETLQKLPQKEVIEIAKQICNGIQAVHEQGIIHRDLKPDNIMLQYAENGKPNIRILDFGIAKVLDPSAEQLTSDEDWVGTLKYMTPEQFMGMPVDARSDVFSICLLVYELLTGVVPPALMANIPPLDNFGKDFYSDLENTLRQGLSRDPSQRPQTAKALHQQLTMLEKKVGPTRELRQAD